MKKRPPAGARALRLRRPARAARRARSLRPERPRPFRQFQARLGGLPFCAFSARELALTRRTWY